MQALRNVLSTSHRFRTLIVPKLSSKTSDCTLPGAPLVKALPVNPTDPSVTGPDLFAKLVPMAAHEASSLYRYASSAAVKRSEIILGVKKLLRL